MEAMPQERSAFIAIVGRPNVGKSSVLNKLIGQKIAIVSKKPQTTRTRIMGVLTHGEDQLVFLDTPGLMKPKTSLGDYMMKSVTTTVDGVDACLLVTEAGAPLSKADEELIRRFQKGKIPAVLAINKIDLLEDKSPIMEQIAQYSALYDFQAVVPVSARDGNGMEDLLGELKKLCMPGGHLFPEDTLTDQPERVIAGEIVREKVLRLLDKEVPRADEGSGRHLGYRRDHLLREKRPQGHPDRQRRRYAEEDRHQRPPGYGAFFRLQGEFAAVGKGERGLAPAS